MSRMNRVKFLYESVIGTSALLGGVVGSSTFAYESRNDRPPAMIGAAIFGGAVGVIGGFFAGATSPVAIPGLLFATAFRQSEYGGKKLIQNTNSFLAGQAQNEHQSANQASPGQAAPGQALPPGSPSAPVSI